HDRGVRRDVGAVPLDPLRRPGVLRVRLGVDAAGVRGAGGPPGLARGRAAAADDPLPALDAAAPGVRGRDDQDARRPLLAGPDRDGPPSPDPADAGPAQPPRAPRPALVAPPRGAGQPRRAAGDHLAGAAAAADRLVRRARGDPHPAVPGGHRQLRLAELVDDPGGVLRDQRLLPALGRGRAVARLGMGALAGGRRTGHGRGLAAVVAAAGPGSVRRARGALVEAAAAPVLRRSADECVLRPLLPGRLHPVYAHGAGDAMTGQRSEGITEGTLAANPGAAAEEGWLPSECTGKPGDVRRRSRQISPYHLPLDWQMWFLALRPAAQPWFV